MTAATRERKLAFINACGHATLRNLVVSALSVIGDEFLTDEQIDTLTESLINEERARTHSNITNRALRAALEEVA